MTRPSPAPPLLLAEAAQHLSQTDRDALHDLYLRGTPDNTLRAYERDLVYVTAWKAAAFDAPLDWPEAETVALRFILDHARDLSEAPLTDPARITAETLIDAGLRRQLTCPAPSTLDRRIASWRAFHGMRNLANPFEAPLVRQARAKARRAAARPPAPKSARPITRDLLEDLLATSGPGHRGLRDRALLLTGWASGGRRRSELTGLHRADIDLEDFEKSGVVWIRLIETKTTTKGDTPRLVLKGRAARALVAWIDAGKITGGPLFRAISKSDRVLKRGLAPEAVAHILRRLLVAAGYAPDHASPHGLRSGFLTQAALDGAPIQAAMRLSLHRSVSQAQRYYDDVDITENPATDLLD
ncbi:tyrosine-type recombinase/integrase [Fluviibacterium sp. S390]|uniref:tyrosine-type recombinase/integrase n=1 Tax=Fluviibacterium sp. S390 TaxID=3415139 RepID=UPI003C7A6F63